jgi:aspartate-semialdehyde dehydrogenase
MHEPGARQGGGAGRGCCGARRAHRHRRRGHPGPLFFEPTLLVEVPDDALIMREETFGPSPPLPSTPRTRSIARANDTEYGLVAYVVTENGARQMRLSARWTMAWSPSTG